MVEDITSETGDNIDKRIALDFLFHGSYLLSLFIAHWAYGSILIVGLGVQIFVELNLI
jgi:hypothetical protein